MPLQITRNNRVLKGRIELPCSKSISNRALILNSLTGNRVRIDNLSDAEDTKLMQEILSGLTRNPSGIQIIDAGNAGTVFRFLTAYLSFCDGEYLLTGNERMKERPVGPLVEALRLLGAEIEYVENEGFPPILIGQGQVKSSRTMVSGTISSQFVSALLLISPLFPGGLNITLGDSPSSSPYIDMTVDVVRHFGYVVTTSTNSLTAYPAGPPPDHFRVEPDWSAFAFWLEMALMADEVDLTFPGLSADSIQGDRVIADVSRFFGFLVTEDDDGIRMSGRIAPAVPAFRFDFNRYPDLALPVIIGIAGAGGEAVLLGLGNLVYKESDRLRALRETLAPMGYVLKELAGPAWKLSALPGKSVAPVSFRTYGDHRVAMSLAALALKGQPVLIDDPDCVKKSYPDFWDHLENMGFKVEEV